MSWLLSATAASLLLLVYWLQWRWSHKRMLELAAKVPGPPAWPIVGNSLLFVNPAEQLNRISELTQKYGDYLRIWLGPELNIFIRNPADIRLILTSSKVNQKGPVYDLMRKYIGPGILTGGPTWRNHRKIATPSYNKKCVQKYAAIFNEEAETLAETLSSKKPGATLDVYLDVVKTTTQCVCQTLMGLSKDDSQNINRLDEVVSLTQRMYGFIFGKMTRWWLQIPFVFWLLGAKKTEDHYLKAIDDLSSDIVKRRRKDLESAGVSNEETLGVVDRYILSGELTEQEIKWETFSLFTTSQEASAKIASGVLMFLGHLPDWQELVYNEIVQVLGPHDAPVSMEQVKELHYLDMVYKETLRYFSIAALIQRTVEEEITIHDGKITLPVGTSLVIPIHDLHRESRYWREPHRVMPERFLPENVATRDPNAFVPFSLGAMDCLGTVLVFPIHDVHLEPRYWREPYRVMPERFLPENVATRDPNAFVPFSLGAMDCLGRVYATALIKILVVRVLRKVQLKGCGSIDNLPLDVAISVKPRDGYKLRVEPRIVRNGRIHA